MLKNKLIEMEKEISDLKMKIKEKGGRKKSFSSVCVHREDVPVEYTRKASSKPITIFKRLSPSASSHIGTTSVHTVKSHADKLQAEKFCTAKKSHIVKTSHVDKSVHTNKFVQDDKTFGTINLSQDVKT